MTDTYEAVDAITLTLSDEEQAIIAAAMKLQESPEYMALLEHHNEIRNALLSAKDQYGNYKHSTREVQNMLHHYRELTLEFHRKNDPCQLITVEPVTKVEPAELTELAEDAVGE